MRPHFAKRASEAGIRDIQTFSNPVAVLPRHVIGNVRRKKLVCCWLRIFGSFKLSTVGWAPKTRLTCQIRVGFMNTFACVTGFKA